AGVEVHESQHADGWQPLGVNLRGSAERLTRRCGLIQGELRTGGVEPVKSVVRLERGRLRQARERRVVLIRVEQEGSGLFDYRGLSPLRRNRLIEHRLRRLEIALCQRDTRQLQAQGYRVGRGR